MTRVLLVGKGAPERGGIPTFLAQIVATPWTEHEIDFCNLAPEGDRQGGKFTATNLRRTLADLRTVARRQGVEVVHFHSAVAPLSTLLRAAALLSVARLGGRSVILHAHGGRLVDWADSTSRRRLLRWAVGGADRIVVVSAGLEATMRAAGVRPPVERLTNGVDTARFAPSDVAADNCAPHNEDAGDTPALLYVGHLSERKGVFDLLDASRRLTANGMDHRLLLAGGTPDEGQGERDPRIDAPPSAEFLGPIDPADMPDLYRRCDVFCLPSWWEATPLSVLEAMATGLPVVATDVGDVADMIGDAGLVVRPNKPTELASALQTLIADPELRRHLGDRARQRVVARHDLAAVRQRLADIYSAAQRKDR